MKKYKYGIIGVGNIGMTKHLPGYAQLNDDIVISAACDIDETKLNVAAEKYNIPNIYTDYHKLLDQNDLDFVSICLPNYLHAPVAIEAMEKGKHVHCEKPMALNYEQAKLMYAKHVSTKKQLMIGLNNRFTAESQYIKRFIESGGMGEVYYAKCGWCRRAGAGAYGWFTDKELSGGGPLIDLGVHFIDLVMYFQGYPKVEKISANTYSKLVGGENGYLYTHDNSRLCPDTKFNVEDMAVGFIQLENSSSINFEISWASHIETEESYFSLYGTKAGISYSNKNNINKLSIHTISNNQHVDIYPKIKKTLSEIDEFKHFISCITENCESTISVLEENLLMSKLIEDIYCTSNNSYN